MTAARTDIQDRDDIERLVRAFYARAMSDAMIGYLFADVARIDLDEHVPRVASFWETVLLGAGSYGGGAFAPHASLHRLSPLRSGHFARWLTLWTTTVDELFAGPVADLAKTHATRVAAAFERRVAGLDADASGGDGLPLTIHAPRPARGSSPPR